MNSGRSLQDLVFRHVLHPQGFPVLFKKDILAFLKTWGIRVLPWNSRPLGTVSQLLFRTFGACSYTTFYPPLAPWAAFLRRFAARIVTRGPLFVQSGGCDTVSSAPRKSW